MLRWIFFVLLVIPLMDILILIFVAGEIGVVATVALVVLTGLIGLLLVRAEGRHTIARLQQKVAQGAVPTDELLDGGLLIAAGAFLLTPGLVTDGIGLLLVLPPTRYLLRGGLKRWVVVPIADARTGGFVTGKVYTSGFPDEEGTETYDLGGDSYDIDVDDDPENGGKGNP